MICKKPGATALIKLIRYITAAAGLALPIEALADCDNTTLNGSYLFQDLWVNAQAPNCQFTPPSTINCDAVPGTNTVKGIATFDGAGGAVFNLQVRHIDRGGLTTSTISGPGTTERELHRFRNTRRVARAVHIRRLTAKNLLAVE